MSEEESKIQKMKSSEVDALIVDLHKKGNTPAKIGLILRDNYGISKEKLGGRKITKILKDGGMAVENELEAIKKKVVNLEKHISKNIRDYSAKRSHSRKRWIVHKLSG